MQSASVHPVSDDTWQHRDSAAAEDHHEPGHEEQGTGEAANPHWRKDFGEQLAGDDCEHGSGSKRADRAGSNGKWPAGGRSKADRGKLRLVAHLGDENEGERRNDETPVHPGHDYRAAATSAASSAARAPGTPAAFS